MNHPTFTKLAIANFAGACVVAWAFWVGLVERVFLADGSGMTLVISGVFLVGVASVMWRSFHVDATLRRKNSWEATTKRHVRRGTQAEYDLGEEYRVALRKSAHLHDLLVILLMLGIVGNALGFLTAFSGVDVSTITSADGLKKAGVQLMSGAGTAFGSTITGLILAVWTTINIRILETSIDRINVHV